MRICTKCKEEKSDDDFSSDKSKKHGLTFQCKTCRASYAKYTRKKNPFAKMLAAKKHICKVKGLPFDLDQEYLESIYTETCPIFGVKMIQMNSDDPRHDDNATLDRMIPEKGYVKGNVTFICFRANRIKSDASLEEIQKIISWMKSK